MPELIQEGREDLSVCPGLYMNSSSFQRTKQKLCILPFPLNSTVASGPEVANEVSTEVLGICSWAETGELCTATHFLSPAALIMEAQAQQEPAEGSPGAQRNCDQQSSR